jgi:methyltransferase family protein
MTSLNEQLRNDMHDDTRFVPHDWSAIYQRAVQFCQSGLILEFGVASGASLRWISGLVSPRRVVGFDSFKGLPEAWKENAVGTFACKKPRDMPPNVEIVDGMFQDTLKGWLEKNDGPIAFVNMDADLYSSTEYVLRQIEKRFVAGTFLHFDEIRGHPDNFASEGKAFLESLARTGMIYRCLTKTGNEGALFKVRWP